MRFLIGWNLFNKVLYKKEVWFHGLIAEFIYGVLETFTRVIETVLRWGHFAFQLVVRR